MRLKHAYLLIAVLALPSVPTALAQDTKDAQNKLLAKRAAPESEHGSAPAARRQAPVHRSDGLRDGWFQ